MVQELEYKIYLYMLGAAKKENEILYAAGWTNGIFKTNMLTEETEYIACFETKKPMKQTMYGIVIRAEEEYFFLPYNEELLAVYDPVTKSIKYKNLMPAACKRTELRIGAGFLFQEYIVMISAEKNVPIILYNYKDESVHYIEDITKLIEDHVIYDSYVFAQGYYVYDNKIYLVIQGTALLVEVDLVIKKSSLIRMDFGKDKDSGINAVTGAGDKLYLFEEYGEMIVWSIREEKVLLYKPFKKELSKGEIQVQSALAVNHRIWIFLVGTDEEADIVLRYDYLSGKMDEVNLKDRNIMTGGFDKRLYGYLFAQNVDQDCILACSANSSQLIYIDEKNNLMKRMSLEYSNREYAKNILKESVLDENLVENGILVLCDCILQQPAKVDNDKLYETCGELILKSIGV